MGTLATKDVALAFDRTRLEEEHQPYLWLEDYIERLEEKAAREEFLDSYEYHSLVASLLA